MITKDIEEVKAHLAEVQKKRPNCYLGIATKEKNSFGSEYNALYVGPQKVEGDTVVLNGYIKYMIPGFGEAFEMERKKDKTTMTFDDKRILQKYIYF